jgi:hypothetical protein
MSIIQATSKDGFVVCLDSLYIQRSGLGYLVGTPDRIRSHFLNDGLLELINSKYRTMNSYVVAPPEGELPAYVIIADLTSNPIDDKYDISGLILCWFVDNLCTPLPDLFTHILADFTWRDHALDGDY